MNKYDIFLKTLKIKYIMLLFDRNYFDCHFN